MKPREGLKNKRGTTLVEVLVAMALMLLIFLFLTADLIQSSQAENLASNHTGTVAAANYLLGVMRDDSNFWSAGDWVTGPGTDPCLVAWAPYTDDITKPTWHPMCDQIFPEATGAGVHFSYMWNAQLQAGDTNVAQLTMWVETDEGGPGRQDIYELRTTRMQTAPQAQNSGVVPQGSPSPSPSPTTPPPSKSPGPSPSPKPSPSPTKKPSPTPTPSPLPSGILE